MWGEHQQLAQQPKQLQDSFVNAFVNIYGAPPRTEADMSVAVDEACGVEEFIEEGFSAILIELGS